MKLDNQKISAIRGMPDLLPENALYLEELENIIQEWLHSYGYCNLRVPILERTQLFARCIGENTDIVEKEMYSFKDTLNNDLLTVRPEITAGIIRASIEHNLLYDRPRRVYSIGPVFRHERPQAGRYRQFHQVDVEALGFKGPDIDAEFIIMLDRLWKKLNLNNIRLEINSLGKPNERIIYREALIQYFENYKNVFNQAEQRRLYSNPLRILDSKNPTLRDIINKAPSLFNFLGKESREHFEGLCHYLDNIGIRYNLNPYLVRGLDYYSMTVFEWITDNLGAQGTICGGGRYNNLIESLGGKLTPAAGFAIGLDRLLNLWRKYRCLEKLKECEIYLMYQGLGTKKMAFLIGEMLRDANFSVIVHSGDSELRKQFKLANISGAWAGVIIGSNEITEQKVSVKLLRENIQNRPQQIQISLDKLIDFLKSESTYNEISSK